MIFATGSSKPDGPGALTNFLRSCTVASCDAAADVAVFCCADTQSGTETKIKIARMDQIRSFPLEVSSGFRKITRRQGIWARAPAQQPVSRGCSPRSELAGSEWRAIQGKRAGHRSECAWRVATNEKLSDDGHRGRNHKSADDAKGTGTHGRCAPFAKWRDTGHRHRVAHTKRIILGIEFSASQDECGTVKARARHQVRR